jgi:hypothetical protein
MGKVIKVLTAREMAERIIRDVDIHSVIEVTPEYLCARRDSGLFVPDEGMSPEQMAAWEKYPYIFISRSGEEAEGVLDADDLAATLVGAGWDEFTIEEEAE